MGEESKKYKLERLTHMEGVQLTENTYNLTIGLVLLWGIAINIVMAMFFTPQIMRLNYYVILIAYLVLGFGGTMIVFKSNNPAASFGGFTMLSVGMGLLLTFFLTAYSGHTVYTAFLLTGIIVVTMMILSTVFPSFFLSIGRGLGIALLAAIAVELIGGLLLRLDLGFMDYAVVAIFAGYIGFDWAKAQAYPKTLDNAIDSAADIYVDIINIFIRILSILGRKND